MTFEVFGEPPAATDPGEGAFDDPAFWDNHEAMQVAALDDLDAPPAGCSDSPRRFWSLIAGVGEDALYERKQAPRALVEHEPGAVAILHVGRVDHDIQQEAERVDEDVALATLDLLARVIARRIERGPPFCAPLALWASMIATVGLASRPACSRVAT